LLQTEIDWAKRRKSEYMVPGLINYTRQVIRDSDKDWVPVPIHRTNEAKNKMTGGQQPPQPQVGGQKGEEEDDIWPRRRKSEFVPY